MQSHFRFIIATITVTGNIHSLKDAKHSGVFCTKQTNQQKLKSQKTNKQKFPYTSPPPKEIQSA